MTTLSLTKPSPQWEQAFVVREGVTGNCFANPQPAEGV